MFTKKTLKKFGFRWLVVNVVFILVKLTVEHDEGETHDLFTRSNAFYYLSAFFLFMVAWEHNDWLIKRQLKKGGLDLKNSLNILVKTLLVFLPISALTYYLALYQFKVFCGIITNNVFEEFLEDFSRGATLCTTVVFFNLFHHAMNQREEMKKQMEDLKKEMLASKYTSLKNQISPHFLFNSLNTLTSLMYEDRDLASDFVTRLASSYRYILDNREEDLVSLSKELNFLDSFIFMMNVRHKEAVFIRTDIFIRAENYVIPTLSLQMLVENALKHNYYSKEKPLLISITTIDGEVLKVKNNLRKRELKEDTTRLGIKNIKKRYSYYTNTPVLVEEESGYFEVTIPLLNKEITEINLLSV